jgi:hypothetical protein
MVGHHWRLYYYGVQLPRPLSPYLWSVDPMPLANLISFCRTDKKTDTYVEISCNFPFVFIFGWWNIDMPGSVESLLHVLLSSCFRWLMRCEGDWRRRRRRSRSVAIWNIFWERPSQWAFPYMFTATPTSAPWRMNGKWSRNSFLLSSSSLANYGS